MPDLIQTLEEMAINAFPALKTELYDGWVLRFSNGYTYRGNSVNPLYPSHLELPAKIAYCEDRYFSVGLPAVYKMTESAPPGLDLTLAELGYEIKRTAHIMTLKLGPDYEPQAGKNDVIVAEGINDEWLERVLALNGTEEQVKWDTAKQILCNISHPVFRASLEREGRIIACGLGVLERSYIGLFDIYVDEGFRRQGIAYALCHAIINSGFKAGAAEAYLQVMADNGGAIRLYEKLGFAELYTYWYRVKNNLTGSKR